MSLMPDDEVPTVTESDDLGADHDVPVELVELHEVLEYGLAAQESQ